MAELMDPRLLEDKLDLLDCYLKASWVIAQVASAMASDKYLALKSAAEQEVEIQL